MPFTEVNETPTCCQVMATTHARHQPQYSTRLRFHRKVKNPRQGGLCSGNSSKSVAFGGTVAVSLPAPHYMLANLEHTSRTVCVRVCECVCAETTRAAPTRTVSVLEASDVRPF